MYVQMHGVVTSLPSEEELNKLSYDLVSTFGKENFSHFLYDKGTTYERDLALMQVGRIYIMYCEDCEDVIEIKPEEGKYFISVDLNGAYYGFRYQCGNFWLYKSVAEWLEYRIPGIVIYYGGSEVVPTELTKEYREALWKDYVFNGRNAYYDMFTIKHKYIQHPLCPLCKIEMHSSDWKQDEMIAIFNCRACETKLITEDGGERYQLTSSENF